MEDCCLVEDFQKFYALRFATLKLRALQPLTLRAQRLKKINLDWKFQSRLKFSISIEIFNPDLQKSPQKIGVCSVARLKFSISLENFKILSFLEGQRHTNYSEPRFSTPCEMRFFPREKGKTAFSKKNPRQRPFSLSRMGKIASRKG